MAVSTLVRHSEDKYTRQAYQRRKDDIYFYNKEKNEYKRRLEQEQRRAERAESALEEKDTTIADQAKLIAELQSRLGEK
ncbi:MAG: hypothetical protein FWG63_06760 [Defluviitaleaceae bacterium]|nr:hypothetical protein [Defluviitaleaceae bacterium]